MFFFQNLVTTPLGDGYREHYLTQINPKESKNVLEIMRAMLSLQAMKNNIDKISKNAQNLNYKDACKNFKDYIEEDSNQDLGGLANLGKLLKIKEVWDRLQNDKEIKEMMEIISDPESFMVLIQFLPISKDDEVVGELVKSVGDLIAVKKKFESHRGCLDVYYRVETHKVEYLRQ